VALLIAAAERNPMDCLSPVVNLEEPATHPGTAAQRRTGHYPDDDYDDNGPIRVGEEEDDDILNDDDYIDRHKGSRSRQPKTQKPQREASPIISRIKEKFTKIFRDDEADRFDDEEEE
jgi:hypothetical protein